MARPLGEELDLHTVGDLLRHYPRRYARRGELTPMHRLEVGEEVTLVAKVVKATARVIPKNGRRLQILTLTVGDGSQTVDCTFFNQNFLARAFPVGTEGIFSGRIKRFNRTLQLEAPQAASLDGYLDEDGKVERIQSFAGVYPIYAIAGKLKLKSVQDAVAAVLATLGTLPDPVPPDLLTRHGLVGLTEALASIHQPAGDRDIELARARLRYDEALAMQLVLAQRRAGARSLPAAPCPQVPDGLLAAFDRRLPFPLTAGQQEVGDSIAADLATVHPMHRLLQGEVGSGKTVVALRAMLQVVDAGRQTVLLAPTEVLAAQHARSLTELLGPLATAGELGAPGGDQGDPVDRLAVGAGPPTGVAGHRVRSCRRRGRHPRAARQPGRLRRPRPGGGGRAAPLRRRAAGPVAVPRPAGPPAARAGDDRDPDPAHGGDDRLRGPGDVDPDRVAGRPVPDQHDGGPGGGEAGLARSCLAAGARGGGRGTAGLHRVPPDRRRRGRADGTDGTGGGFPRRTLVGCG